MPIARHPILKRVTRKDDLRGWFLPTHSPDLPVVNWSLQNLSYSKKGVVRGLHFQCPFSQSKQLTVVAGEIQDVVLNIDPTSRSFGEWAQFRLSADDESCPNQIFIPNTYAHGFSTPNRDALVAYLTDEVWHPEAEEVIDPFDSELNIPWGIESPICSDKDLAGQAWSSFQKLS